VKIILNELFQTIINLKTTDNYILHEAVQQLKLILQQQRNSAQMYITNASSMIVRSYVHMKIIVENVLQKLTFNILNIKYNTILKML